MRFSNWCNVSGTVVENNESIIELKNIKVVTPTGDIIVPDLDLQMKPGTHLLITGTHTHYYLITFQLVKHKTKIINNLTNSKRSKRLWEIIAVPDSLWTVASLRRVHVKASCFQVVLHPSTVILITRSIGSWNKCVRVPDQTDSFNNCLDLTCLLEIYENK